MSRKTRVITAVALALIAGAGLVLGRFQAGRRLGEPGVRLTPVPTLAEDGHTISAQSVALPDQPLDYTSQSQPVTKAELDMLPKDTTYGRRLYHGRDGFQVSTSVVLMGTDRTSIHKPEYCLPGQGFRIDHQETDFIRIPGPTPYDLPVRKILASKEARDRDGRLVAMRAVYVFWFVCEDRLTDDQYQRMAWMASDLLREGKFKRWAYVWYLALCPPGAEQATYDRLKQLIAASVPEFQTVKVPGRLLASAPRPRGDRTTGP